MSSYLNRQFRKGTTEYGVYASADGNELRVEISCHNLNFKSFWGGEWLSSWLIDLASSNISGSIKVQNHYFEQGNIQFNMNKDIPAAKLSAQTGRAVVDFIAKSETTY
jgi:capping protein (actin filament) muscle Z-line, alpha